MDHDPNIVAITETWLDLSVLDNEIVPPGYNIFRKDRGSRGGGVALIVQSSLIASEIEGAPGIENVWCRIKLKTVN